MRRVLAVAVLLAATYTAPDPAYAIACSNCSTIALQVKEHAMQAKQYADQLKSYLVQANEYKLALENTAKLPLSAIAKVQSTYYRVSSLARQVQGLAGPNGSIMQRVSSLNSIANGVTRIPGSIEDQAVYWDNQRQRQFEENSRLLDMEEERRSVNDEMMELAGLNADTATGQLQVLQANNQATLAVAQQLQALNSRMQADYVANMEKEAREAAIRKAEQDFMTAKKGSASPWIR